MIKGFLVRSCQTITRSFFWSGCYRTYTATTYDFCFMIMLNLYDLNFNDEYSFNNVGSYFTVGFVFIYFSIIGISIKIL